MQKYVVLIKINYDYYFESELNSLETSEHESYKFESSSEADLDEYESSDS